MLLGFAGVLNRVNGRSFEHIGHLTDIFDRPCKIGQVTDVWPGSGGHDRVVVITIRLDAIEPPAGRVSLAEGREVAFVGWLGLLRVLSELLESSSG